MSARLTSVESMANMSVVTPAYEKARHVGSSSCHHRVSKRREGKMRRTAEYRSATRELSAGSVTTAMRYPALEYSLKTVVSQRLFSQKVADSHPLMRQLRALKCGNCHA